MLQQSVDTLFDNNRQASRTRFIQPSFEVVDRHDQGKQGRFRENLLGKRVDYRHVVSSWWAHDCHQCGLPKKIALELYQPFIIRRLKDLGTLTQVSQRRKCKRKDEEVWDILEQVIANHPMHLNRAPTLHRMGIQAFEPTVVEATRFISIACL